MLQRTPDYNYIPVLFVSTRGGSPPPSLGLPLYPPLRVWMEMHAEYRTDCTAVNGVPLQRGADCSICLYRGPLPPPFVQRSSGTSKLTALRGTQWCVRASRGADFAPPTRRRTIWVGRLNVARLRGVQAGQRHLQTRPFTVHRSVSVTGALRSLSCVHFNQNSAKREDKLIVVCRVDRSISECREKLLVITIFSYADFSFYCIFTTAALRFFCRPA